LLVVSVAGIGEAWPDDGVARLGARIKRREAGLVVLEAGRCPDEYPRRRRTPTVFDGMGEGPPRKRTPDVSRETSGEPRRSGA
jgi:hypothetical protein